MMNDESGRMEEPMQVWQRDAEWLEPLEHTADEGIVVTAHDLPQLFERTAIGMFSIIADLATVQLTDEIQVDVGAEDRAALLVAWLSELNFRHVTEGLVFGGFEVTEASGTRAAGKARGEHVDPSRHEVYTEIKAVTYHGLTVMEENGLWKAQVLFDV